MEFDQAHLMLLAGFVLLGWVLARRSIVQRRRTGRESQASGRALRQLRDAGPRAAPLCDAPAETQRWQVALFDLQRDLKADLDTRIAIVQSLVRQADERIEQLSRLQSDAGESTAPAAMERRSGEALGGEALGGEALSGEALSGRDVGETWAGRPELRQISELAQRGFPAAEIAERLGRPIGDVELALATLDQDER